MERFSDLESFVVVSVLASQEAQDEDELNIAPRKVNWDLKRDIEEKLRKLDRRTQRAIVEIIRERMEEVRPFMLRLELTDTHILAEFTFTPMAGTKPELRMGI